LPSNIFVVLYKEEMPYRLRKAPKRDAYWVVDDSGKHYSKDPLPKERAREQQKALYASEQRGKGQFISRIRGRDDPRAVRTYRPTGLREVDVAYDNPEPHDTENPSTPPVRAPPPSEKPKKKQDPQPLRAKGLCGGQLTKRPYETEEAFQKRRIASEQQQRRLADAGITPEMRQKAMGARAELRRLEDIKARLGQTAVERAYEADPRTIAKRAEIARKERENAIFNPLLEGAIELGKNLGKLPGVPSWLGKVSETTASYLGDQMAKEEAMRQARAEKVALGEEMRMRDAPQQAEDLRQLGVSDVGQVNFQDLQRRIEEQQRLVRGGAGMPRFGSPCYFG
jgi:hypothetical protein